MTSTPLLRRTASPGPPRRVYVPGPLPIFCSRSLAAMASSMALLLLLLLPAVASTTAELDERELASTIAELLKAALMSTAAELDDVEPGDSDGYRTYIVMLEPPEEGQDADADAARAWHRSFLPSATTAQGKPRLLYSYRTIFTGFAARLTEKELKEVSAKPGFVRSFDNNIYRAQTTHTTAFLASLVDLSNHIGGVPR
ncbi:hypothetical protein CFC21_083089 [Triticum aestivum]|uniref:Inhibitor I9 domain-containing protein n=2 Tax=Triticum aestivum TaxID=4565 RepID=A0A9R1DET0_WHEAT|nr:subtilisin-like protease [Triticum aestivum]KAF6990504.1 hypothetical protein CFC21_007687 [Triticum aestivum]KAF7078701.1 hypothetical protein CFC21_083089 [Triticum aestivum]